MLDSIIGKNFRDDECLNFIASENKVSYIVREALYKYYDINNRYFFPHGSKNIFQFPHTEWLTFSYDYIIEKSKKVFNSEYIDLSAISWINLMNIILSWLAQSGDTIMTVSPEDGGHPITAHLWRRLWLKVIYIPFWHDHQIDKELFIWKILEQKPKLIYVDQMTGTSPISLLDIKKYIPETTILHYDISHSAAFVLGSVHVNPLQNGFDSFGWSTHKTIPWPHKGFFCTNKKSAMEAFQSSSLYTVSSNHYWETLAFWFLLEEMEGKWGWYVSRILEHSQYMAKSLENIWFVCINSEGTLTQNHQILISRHWDIDIGIVFQQLSEIGIYVNYIILPWNEWKKWLRIWLQEFTYLWGDILMLERIINIIETLLSWSTNNKELKEEVISIKKELLERYELYFQKEKKRIFL